MSFLPQEPSIAIQSMLWAPTPASFKTSCITFCTLKIAIKSHITTPEHNSISFWSRVYPHTGSTITHIPQEDSVVWGEHMIGELLSSTGLLPLPILQKHIDTHQ